MSSGGWHINSEQEVHRKSTPHLMIYETEEACMKKKSNGKETCCYSNSGTLGCNMLFL